MAIQPNQDPIDEFSDIGPDATAAFEPARSPTDATEFGGSENLAAAPRKTALDEDEEEEDEEDVDDDKDDDDLEDDVEVDDEEDDDDDLEDDDEDDEDEDEDEDEEEDEEEDA